jgi:hypothetical protein
VMVVGRGCSKCQSKREVLMWTAWCEVLVNSFTMDESQASQGWMGIGQKGTWERNQA